MADYVWTQVELAAEEEDWRAALHCLCGSAHRALVSHPWFFAFPVTYGGIARLGVLEATLAHLKSGGLSEDAIYHSQHVIDGYIYGYSWQDIGFDPDLAAQSGVQQMLSTLDPERYSNLLAHAHRHYANPAEGDGFAYGLDILLDGLERTKQGQIR
jgi:hypothetical protein